MTLMNILLNFYQFYSIHYLISILILSIYNIHDMIFIIFIFIFLYSYIDMDLLIVYSIINVIILYH